MRWTRSITTRPTTWCRKREGKKAYQLLLKAMDESAYAAIAKITMHDASRSSSSGLGPTA